jgi:hypothetical protein
MDQQAARERAAQLGAAAIASGITVDDPTNPDMGQLLALCAKQQTNPLTLV